MDNYAKVDLYRMQAKRSQDQANATHDESIRRIMSMLAEEYDKLADIYLSMADSGGGKLKKR